MSTSVGQARQGQNWCSLSTNVSNYKCVFFCNQTTICVEDSATNEASQYYLDVMTNRFSIHYVIMLPVGFPIQSKDDEISETIGSLSSSGLLPRYNQQRGTLDEILMLTSS